MTQRVDRDSLFESEFLDDAFHATLHGRVTGWRLETVGSRHSSLQPLFEVSRVARLLDGSDQPLYFVSGQDRRQCLLFRSTQLLEYTPVTRLCHGVEELDATVGHAQRTGSEVALVDQVQQILADLLFGELISGVS